MKWIFGLFFLSIFSVRTEAQYFAGLDIVVVDEDGSVDIDVLGNDTNLSGFFDYTIEGIPDFPDHGTATFIEATQTIIYEPEPNYHGSDVFTYTGCVNSGAICGEGNVIVTVNSVPDMPIADDEIANTFHITPVTANILLGDVDIDGDGLDVTIVDDGANGTAVYLGDSIVEYTPVFGFLGVDIVTYRICNAGSDIFCDEGTITITVVTNNFNKPNANDDLANGFADSTLTIDAVANDFDGDADAMEISELIMDGAFGSATITADNKVEYISPVVGEDSFQYVVCDVNAPPYCDTAYIHVVLSEKPVIIPDIHVPNSFSPNSDNINDVLEIIGLEGYASFYLRIYNRWNDLVYENSDPNKMWNGKANAGILAVDKELPDGTYFYILELTGKADPLRGFIVLKR